MAINHNLVLQPILSRDGSAIREVNDFKYLGLFVANRKTSTHEKRKTLKIFKDQFRSAGVHQNRYEESVYKQMNEQRPLVNLWKSGE